MEKIDLTENQNRGYTAHDTPNSESPGAGQNSAHENGAAGRFDFTVWLQEILAHHISSAELPDGRDSAQNCETKSTELAGTLTKGAKAPPGQSSEAAPGVSSKAAPRRKQTHQQRRRERSEDRQALRRKAEHERFVDRFGKFVSRETGTIFVPDDLDFDPKRQNLEKNLAKDRPTDQVALARELLASIQSELQDDDDDPEKSPTLIGLVAALTGARVSGRKDTRARG